MHLQINGGIINKNSYWFWNTNWIIGGGSPIIEYSDDTPPEPEMGRPTRKSIGNQLIRRLIHHWPFHISPVHQVPSLKLLFTAKTILNGHSPDQSLQKLFYNVAPLATPSQKKCIIAKCSESAIDKGERVYLEQRNNIRRQGNYNLNLVLCCLLSVLRLTVIWTVVSHPFW